MAINFSLKFENILNVALLDLPKQFILDTSVNQKEFIENIFSIGFIKNALKKNQEELDVKYPNYDLFDLQKLISYQTFYSLEHIMLANIHWSIFGIIKSSKFYDTKHTIRQALSAIDNFNYLVRCNFEKDIQRRLVDKIDWSDEDIELIKEYFKVNGTVVEELKDII